MPRHVIAAESKAVAVERLWQPVVLLIFCAGALKLAEALKSVIIGSSHAQDIILARRKQRNQFGATLWLLKQAVRIHYSHLLAVHGERRWWILFDAVAD